MNYGKSAYLKVVELEKRLSFSKEAESFNHFLEFNKINLNQSIYNGTSATLNFPSLVLEKDREICFQIKLSLDSRSQDNLEVKIKLDSLMIASETLTLDAKRNELVCFKPFNPVASGKVDFSLELVGESTDNVITIDDVKVVIIGLSESKSEGALDMRAINFEDKVAVSYVEASKLYLYVGALTQKALPSNDFELVCDSLSHSFVTKTKDGQTSLMLFNVSPNGVLSYFDPKSSLQPIIIASGVSYVDAKTIERNGEVEEQLVLYIKNGEVFYASIKGTSLLSSRKLALPKHEYVEVNIASAKEDPSVYVIATSKSGASYIMQSVLEASSRKFIDYLNLGYNTIVKKYIDMAVSDSKSVHYIKANYNFFVNPYVLADRFLNRKAVSHAKLAYSLSGSSYELPGYILYGVKLDKRIKKANAWASYCDDAEGLQGAYMDHENDIFVDNGWNDRWPFNEIRPCIMKKTGEIVGYLDKNDFKKFEDGTAADITTKGENRIMVEFPKVYYKISADENFNYVQISDSPLEGFCCLSHVYKGKELSRIYVDAYTGPDSTFSLSSGLESLSGQKVHNAADITYLKCSTCLSRTCEPRFEYLTYNIHNLLCVLFIIMFKSTDSINALGTGFSEFLNPHITGDTDSKGMNYGTKQEGHIKVFGLEDYFGARRTLCLGMYIDSSNNFRVIDVYDPESDYAFAARTNYLNIGQFTDPEDSVLRVAVSIAGDNRIGFLHTSDNFSDDETDGFCDKSILVKNSCWCAVGNKGGGGIFENYLLTTAANRGHLLRLVYFPNK